MSHKQDVSDFELPLGELLIVLSDISAGDYQSRCPTELPLTHPLGALCAGVNEMIDALQKQSMERDAYERELQEKLATIQSQSIAIRQLSTPIIEVWQQILCLMVIGAFDDARSDDVTTDLLDAVVKKSARCVIIDITGAEITSAANAQLFVRLVKAVRLLGAQCLLTGISSSLAVKLIQMDIDLMDIRSYPSLCAALKALLRG